MQQYKLGGTSCGGNDSIQLPECNYEDVVDPPATSHSLLPGESVAKSLPGHVGIQKPSRGQQLISPSGIKSQKVPQQQVEMDGYPNDVITHQQAKSATISFISLGMTMCSFFIFVMISKLNRWMPILFYSASH